jgi:LuxR family transcriptional regulator, quorum-sensing system regulator BjaR1
MLSKILEHVAPALAASTEQAASHAFYDAMVPLGATYLQTRHYRRPSQILTSQSHFAAGGIIARFSPADWPGSSAYNYICFEQNPLLAPIREGQTRYLFSDFAPYTERRFKNYWDAMGEAAIADAICATSYGPDQSITSLHLGIGSFSLSADETKAISLAGLMLTEHLMGISEPPHSAPIHLTPRERDCLAFVAEGKSDWETSVILMISEATVRFHVDNARRKLHAVNRTHAVARLITLRML